MKNVFIAIFGLLVLTSCEGDRGPQGPPGPQGPQGPYIVGTVFEIANVNFNPGNNYSFIRNFYDYVPGDIEIYDSDVVLIYLNEGVANNGNDIWSLMPQTFFLSGGGSMQYNYNHTLTDFEIYLHGNVNLDALPLNLTQNQIFRIAILPAEFAQNTEIDITDYNSVISAMQAENPDFEVHKLEK